MPACGAERRLHAVPRTFLSKELLGLGLLSPLLEDGKADGTV